MRKKHNWLFTALTVILCMLLLTAPVFATTVSSVIEETWNTANSQVKDVVDKVVFPVLALVLAVAFFGKLALAYFDYKKHGSFEWSGPAILFACLVFCLLAPQFIWKIIPGMS